MAYTYSVPFVRRTLSTSIALATAALSFIGAPAAFGQESSSPLEALEEVIVTGTHIKGTPVDTAAPVSVINRGELEDIGSPSVVEIIRNLGVSSGIDGESNQFGSNRLEGTSNVNLRGLGAGRTLVLLNGRRQTFSPQAISDQQMLFVDTNQIPSIAIQRLEVLKDGAAATYGSDAIAGVVNFLTREDFEGAEVTGSFKHIDDSDGDYDLGAIFGLNFGNTHWVTSIGVNHRSELNVKDRDFALQDFSDNPEGGWSSIGNPVSIFNLGLAAVDHPAPFVADPNCNEVGGLQANIPGGASICRFQYTFFDNLVEEEDRFQLFSEVNHDFSDSMSLHLEALYAKTDVDSWKTSPSYPPQVLVDFGTRFVPANHPGWQDLVAQNPSLASLVVPAGVFGPGVPAQNGVAYMGRVAGVSGPAQEGSRNHETIRLAAALEGSFSNGMGYDAGIAYSSATMDQKTPDVPIHKLSEALNGFGLCANSDGTVPATAVAGQDGCQYYNPFSNAYEFSQTTGQVNPNFNPAVANSPELMDWLFEDVGGEFSTELYTADFTVSGEGMALAGGIVGYAVGAQYRYETYEIDPLTRSDLTLFPCPDPSSTTCASETGLYGFLTGERPEDVDQDIIALYGETRLPFTDSFSMQAALRYEDYGGKTGDTIDPKIAVRWQLTDMLALRSSASTTFRGPTLNQLNGSQTTLAFVSEASAFKAIESVGNPDLKPESATTFNVGLIADLLEDTLFATVDYWAFDFQDPIIVEPFESVLASELPGQVIRNSATGDVERIIVNIVNGPDIKTSGVDLALKWTPDGIWAVGAEATYISEYEVDEYNVGGSQVFDSFSPVGQLNTSNFVRPLPRIKGRLFTEADFGQHSVNLVANYVHGYKDERVSTFATITDGKEIDSHVTLDLNYNYALPSGNTRLNVSVSNLTDEDPPFARLDLNYDPFTHSPLGRTVKLTVTHQFGN